MPRYILFPIQTLDERIAMRESLAFLRTMPFLTIGAVLRVNGGESYEITEDEGGLQGYLRERANREIFRKYSALPWNSFVGSPPVPQAEGPSRVSTLLSTLSDEDTIRQLVRESSQRRNAPSGWAAWLDPIRNRRDYQAVGRRTLLIDEPPREPRYPLSSIPTIEEYQSTETGRTLLAQAMVAPLRVRIDSNTLARSIMPVEQLPNESTPFFVSELPGEAMLNPNALGGSLSMGTSIPMFEMDSISSVSVAEIRARRFMPSWFKLGAWVAHTQDMGIFGQIERIDQGEVTISLWKREMTHVKVKAVDLQYLIEADPPIFATRYERDFIL